MKKMPDESCRGCGCNREDSIDKLDCPKRCGCHY